MSQRLYLSTDQENFIRMQSAAHYPQEACGLLIGQGGQVTKIIPSPNLSATPEKTFEIDPALIIYHQKDCRTGPDKIIGHYHSHPDGQAAPSLHDKQQNYDADLIWVIVSVTEEGAQEMNAFATHDGQMAHMLISVL